MKANGSNNIARLSHISSSPKFSFRPRTRAGVKSETPGPGAYSIDISAAVKFDNGAKFGFGSAPRDPARKATSPGPGAYLSPRHGCVGERLSLGAAPQWRFPQTRRMEGGPKLKQAAATPGPGAYRPKLGSIEDQVVQDRAPKWSFGSQDRLRGPHASVQDMPGPGAYESPKHGNLGERKLQLQAPPAWRFGTQAKLTGPHKSAKESPGPGAYETQRHCTLGTASVRNRSPEHRFGSEPRMHTPHIKETPGPGAHGAAFSSFGH